jgi:tRNA-Thr(GGU) m(6)t(6)A37 methyltransferase TsaA
MPDWDQSTATVAYTAIGFAETPHVAAAGTPIQPAGARGVRGVIRLRPELEPALRALDGFSHLVVIFHCDRARPPSLVVTPYLGDVECGVFATRSPSRPNPIGLSVVRLISVSGTVLEIEDVDLLDGTPILDLKPFVPAFDVPFTEVRIGWLEGRDGRTSDARADDRFHRP